MKLSLIVCLILTGGISGLATAAEATAPPATEKVQSATQSPTPAPTKAVSKDGTSREHSFDDLLVQGKYQFSDEAVTTVEGDKVLDSLLGIRTDFKDRMEKSAGRN